ncbi:MAG TPA: hypothetical protein VFK45_00445 [Gammaproteobacteria bacterium]|nr:hypothetical protein [Gammaproteobacteria bacterium]
MGADRRSGLFQFAGPAISEGKPMSRESRFATAAAAAVLLVGVAAAGPATPNLAALVERVPAPPGSVSAAAQKALQSESLTRRIKQLHQDLHAARLKAQKGLTGSQSTNSALASMGVHDEASAAAMQEKLSHMSREEKMAWAMQLQQRQMQAQRRRMHGPHMPSADTQHALEQLERLDTELRGPFNDRTGRYGPSLLDKLNSRYSAADAELEKTLAALNAHHPTPSTEELGLKVKQFGSDSEEVITTYLHRHKLCHRYWDGHIQRAKAWPGIYSDWLKVRQAAWQAVRARLHDIAVREQAALSRITPDGTDGIDSNKMQFVQTRTLNAIAGLIDASQAYKKNAHYRGMADSAAYSMENASHDQRVISGINNSIDYYNKRLNTCLSGTFL